MIAGLELSHIGADLLDHARAVIAWCVWQLWQSRVRSRANVSLHRINAGGVDPHKHLTWPGFRSLHIFRLKNFRPAKRSHSNCLHVFSFALMYTGLNANGAVA